MKNNKIPNFLYEMLIKQYGENLTNEIVQGYSYNRPVTIRVNTLKTNYENIISKLEEMHITYKRVDWFENALILENISEYEIRKLDMYINGEIYMQSLSSMLPPIILNPKENDNILDMTAAPGGKTTELATLSEDKALITACEKNKIRAERLKYNIEKQGANRVNVLIEDATKLNDFLSFDKILLDAPCSGSGTLNLEDEKLEKIFTQELIERSQKVQHNLLIKALKILKIDHEMVYSTCSILEEENEKNLQELLQDKRIEIIPINKEKYKNIKQLPTKIDGTVCIAPNELYEGFFVAKIRRII